MPRGVSMTACMRACSARPVLSKHKEGQSRSIGTPRPSRTSSTTSRVTSSSAVRYLSCSTSSTTFRPSPEGGCLPHSRCELGGSAVLEALKAITSTTAQEVAFLWRGHLGTLYNPVYLRPGVQVKGCTGLVQFMLRRCKRFLLELVPFDQRDE